MKTLMFDVVIIECNMLIHFNNNDNSIIIDFVRLLMKPKRYLWINK